MTSETPALPLDRVAKLAAALSDPHVSVVWNAARDLAALGPAATGALPALSLTLRARDATSVLWARYAIARITGSVEKQLPALIAAIGDRHIFPGMAAAAIAGLGPEAREAIPGLISALAAPEADNRWSAAGALAAMGALAAPAVPALTACLRDEDERVRWYAAWALGCVGTGAEPAVPELTAALNDSDDDVRGFAARALGQLGPAAAGALGALAMLLDDLNETVCHEAATAIAKLTSG